jgi:hypothetical protein
MRASDITGLVKAAIGNRYKGSGEPEPPTRLNFDEARIRYRDESRVLPLSPPTQQRKSFSVSAYPL